MHDSQTPYQRCRGGSPESRERGQSNHLIAAHRSVARKPCPKEQASVDTSVSFGCFVPPILLLAGQPALECWGFPSSRSRNRGACAGTKAGADRRLL
jgi:hypothetical protein